MRISIEEKQTLVARYRAGESVAEICADSGVARSTFYTWIKPYTVTMTDSGQSYLLAGVPLPTFINNTPITIQINS